MPVFVGSIGGVDRSAREHPGAAHEARARVALHEQHLEQVGAAAEQDHGAGGTRLSPRAGGDLLLGAGPIGAHIEIVGGASGVLIGRHSPRLAVSLVRVKWICGSCGFIYDPAEGDPDGGIPSGTPFEEIPETWFCPVCGARKRDLEPYEDLWAPPQIRSHSRRPG